MTGTKKIKIRHLITLSFLAISTLFVVSCNFSSESDDSENTARQENTVTIHGTFTLQGAVPSSLRSTASRSAVPSLPEGVSFSVTAKSAKEETMTASYISSDGEFEIKLTQGEWTLSAEIKKDGTTILSGKSDKISITAEKPIDDEIFIIVKPDSSTGNGTVNLPVNIEETSGIKTAQISWQESSTTRPQKLDFSSSTSAAFTMGGTDIPSGAYTAVFQFYSSEADGKRLLYQCTETINVCSNLCTDSWLKNGTTSSPWLTESDGKTIFTVTKSLVEKFAQTSFFVQGTAGTTYEPKTTASDTNNGTYFDPLSTVQKAVDKIMQINDGETEYSIFIDGTVTAPDTLDSSTTLNFIKIEPQKKLNLTIASLSSTQAEINANTKAGVIDVIGKSETEKTTLVLQNVCITGGKTQKEGVGGGIKAQYTDITLKAGTVIGKKLNPDENRNSSIASSSTYGNYAAKGGGIYLNGCALTIEDDVYICQNYSENEGGGIAAEGNSTIIATGGIIGFNQASSGGVGGGGIYINGGSCELTACTVCLNEASNNGDAIYVDGTLNLSGTAYIAPDNDVYLASGNFVTVTGELTGTLPVATLTPNDYSDNRTMLKSGGSYNTLHKADCDKFAVTKDSTNKKFYRVSFDDSSTTGILKESKLTAKAEISNVRLIPTTSAIDVSRTAIAGTKMSFTVKKKTVDSNGTGTTYKEVTPSKAKIALYQNGSPIKNHSAETTNSTLPEFTLQTWITEGTYSLYMTATVDGIDYSEWEPFIIARSKPISSFSSAPNAQNYPLLAAETGEDFKKLDEWMQNGSTMEGITITLTDNINLTSETEWQPIGYTGDSNTNFNEENGTSFKGTLDGNGKSVQFKINSSTQKMIGLFLRNEGIIENLVVEQYTADGTQIGSSSSNVSRGGAFCVINNGTIRNCINKANFKVYTFWDVGGICMVNCGTIENCMNTGNITMTNDASAWAGGYQKSGGIAGQNEGNIYNCVNTGTISTFEITDESNIQANLSGTISSMLKNDAQIKNCYWLNNCLSRGSLQSNQVVYFNSSGTSYVKSFPDTATVESCGYFESFAADAALTAGNADSCKYSQTLSYGTTLIDALNGYVSANPDKELKQWQTAEDGTITLGF